MPGSSSATATRTSSLGIVREPAAWAARLVEPLPGGAVERQRAVVLERIAQRSGAREDAACHSPARVGIDTDRHRRPFWAWPQCPLAGPPENDPSVPPRPAAGTGRRESGSRGAPGTAQGTAGAGRRQSGCGWRATLSRSASDRRSGRSGSGWSGPRSRSRSSGSQRTAARAPEEPARNGRACGGRRCRRPGRRGRRRSPACTVAGPHDVVDHRVARSPASSTSPP